MQRRVRSQEHQFLWNRARIGPRIGELASSYQPQLLAYIAIAHGLAALCEAPVKASRAKGGTQAAAETTEMEFEEEEE